MHYMVLLDLFCGAGGAAEGYRRAGFQVLGVDIEPQPNYPGPSYTQDALAFEIPPNVQAIHASPPCQAYSQFQRRHKNEHPDLIQATREKLRATGLPYVIENVEGAPLKNPTRLCGSQFGLRVKRHRLFETNFPVCKLPCGKHEKAVPVHGHSGGTSTRDGRLPSIFEQQRAMGIDWMTTREMAEAIPPAYTHYIGNQLMHHIEECNARTA